MDAFSREDRIKLRKLAKKIKEYGQTDENNRRIDLCRRHNMLNTHEPVLMVFPEGAWKEILEPLLSCEGETARQFEWWLSTRVYAWENFHDDLPIDDSWTVTKMITGQDDWGVPVKRSERLKDDGSWGFVQTFEALSDFKKLRAPVVTYDEKGTTEYYDAMNELFGDIIPVRLKGIQYIAFHFSKLYSDFRGLEQMFFDIIDEPDAVREAMSIFKEGYDSLLDQYEKYNLLSLNNDVSYHSSGGNGYTDELPAGGFDPGHVRLRDMLGSAECQEFTVVSPELHREFALEYEIPLLNRLGLTGYGCCEDLTRKLGDVMKIPNLRRISISPWADVQKCAEIIQDKYVFSWKPHPAVMTADIDEPGLRMQIREVLSRTENCFPEIILKDTHTCGNAPERFNLWSRIVREEIRNGTM